MKYIKTFNNHETYELNILVDLLTLSHCQTEEHVHLPPKYFIRYKAKEMISGTYDLILGCFGDAEIIDHIFKKDDEEYGIGIIICNKPITEFTSYPFFNPSIAIELDIPDTLKEINQIFSGSSTDHVKRIIFRSLTPPTLSELNIFNHYWDGINTHLGGQLYPYLKIYVPDESVDAYKAAPNWSAYSDIIFSINQLSQDLEEDEEEDEEEED